MSVCALSEESSRYFETPRALAELRDRGLLDEVRSAACAARLALAPVDHSRLTDRLAALGMMMAPNRPQAEAAIWLSEMARLLRDLPEDVLGASIDELVRTVKFLPTCAEIRAIADPEMDRRRRVVSQLEAMVRYLDSGGTIPKPRHEPDRPKPATPLTSEETLELNALLRRIGAFTRYRDDGSRYEVDADGKQKPVLPAPPRRPTRQDYLAMGVAPEVLDRIAADRTDPAGVAPPPRSDTIATNA